MRPLGVERKLPRIPAAGRVGACRFVSAEQAGVLLAAIDAIDLTYSDGRIRPVAVF